MTLCILTPVYDAAPLVAPFTDMLLRQTRAPDAVVFVDDGSKDGTPAALATAVTRLQAAGIDAQVVTHPENRGRGAARVSALAAAATDHVTWLDIDDIYGPHRIARLVTALTAAAKQAEGQDGGWLLVTPYTLCQATRIETRQEMPARKISTLTELYKTGSGARTPQLQSLAGPLSAWRATGFDAALNWAEDLDFAIRFLGEGGRIVIQNGPRPEDVVYFQSFTRTDRKTVADANARVHDKNAALLAEFGIDAAAELAAKQTRYIAKFAPAEAPKANEGATARLVTPSMLDGAQLKETADGVTLIGSRDGDAHLGFLSPTGGALPLPVGDSLTWADIAAAFGARAARLRVAQQSHRGERIRDYAIHRDTHGQFGLTLAADLRDAARGMALQPASWHEPGRPAGRFVPTHARLVDPDAPFFISFFAGAPSYRQSATRLARALADHGADFEICEFIPEGEVDWTRLCRKKIAYYIAQRQRHRRAIFWIDVDTQLIGDPRALGTGAGHDIGGFLRNFHYLPDFDPHRFARLLHPGYLRFGTGARVDRFFAHMAKVDATAPATATDDWVLQEAMATFDEGLSFGLFSPDAVVTNVEAARGPDAVFQHTDSGNVAHASKTAAQHQSQAMTPPRQMAVLREAARVAIQNGALADAATFLRRMRKVDPDDAETVTRLLNLYIRLDQPKKFRYHFDIAKSNPAVLTAALRANLDKTYAEGDFAAAKRTAERLAKEGTAEDAAFAASRAFRHDFDRRAAKAGVDPATRTDMMWWERPYPGNLGDLLGPVIVEAMTGVPPRYSKTSPRMLAVGSIIRFAKAGDTVWGAGASSRSQTIDPKAQYHAVRGPLTREMVLKAGGTCPPVYGDAAWFMPLIRPAAAAKTHKLGLIRHFAHADRPLEVADDVREIDIMRSGTKGINAFLEELTSCEAILSTSLHGLILAQAYGIPVAWAVDSASGRQIHGDGMKFRDYALSVGAEEYVPVDLADVARVEVSLAALCTHSAPTPPDLRALAEAAPFKVTPAFMAKL